MTNDFNGFEACQILMALKLHYTTDKYDFHKYNGQVRLTPAAFEARKDHYVCNKLAKNYPSRQLMIDFASTAYAHADFPKKLWTNDFLNPKAIEVYKRSKEFTENFSYRFREELDNLFSYAKMNNMSIAKLIVPTDSGGEPPIFTFHKQEPKKFSLESLTVLNRIMNITGSCDTLVSDDLIYPITRNKIKKYELFLVSRIDDFYLKGMKILKEKVKEYL